CEVTGVQACRVPTATGAPLVGEVAPDSVAERAGLQAGMEMLGVDGRQVTSWRDVNMRLLERAGEQGPISLEVSRDGARGTFSAPLNGWNLSNDEPNPLAEFGITPWRPDVPAVPAQI